MWTDVNVRIHLDQQNVCLQLSVAETFTLSYGNHAP